jgi:GntR family transcriptional repressor for pyruvate dehydrogenase complex
MSDSRDRGGSPARPTWPASPVDGETDAASASTNGSAKDAGAAERVVHHVRALLERGAISPGDRLPGERQLAVQTGVSRSSVRIGLRALSAMGVIQSRHGSGTFITDGPPALESEPLQFLAALHNVNRGPMFEARKLLEVGVAGLAAQRATNEDLVTLAEEVANMFASLDDPQAFLVHDIRFHRALAIASANPIVASLVEMVSGLFYESRKANVHRARDLRESAEMHRRIYHAVRARDSRAASRTMDEHLSQSEYAQVTEEALARDV